MVDEHRLRVKCPGLCHVRCWKHHYRIGTSVANACRYKILLPAEQQAHVDKGRLEGQAALSATEELLRQFKVPLGQYEMGRTKVFFRPGESLACHWALCLLYYMGCMLNFCLIL